MRVKHKIFSGFITLSCIGVLFAYAGSSRMYFANLPEGPSIGEPAATGSTGPTGPNSGTGKAGATGPTGPMKDPMKDREGDFVTDKVNDPFYLKDPPVIVEDVEYDPTTGMYVVTEKVGGRDVKPPMYMSYDDYLKYTEKQEQRAYVKDRNNAVNLVEEKSIVPPVQVKKQFFDRLFGGSKIEIKPQGNVEMTLGANIQQTANPNIPIRNRKTGGFDFDMNININVIGKIGDKLQLGVKYNTQSGFAFDNTVKIGYTGEPDDIIKSIEAGNVSLPLPTRLISGSQTLFGVKTQFQFGRLTWTSVISQQQSKKETLVIENGAQRQTFTIHSDQYEENKHFLLGQFFYNNYDHALSRLPNIQSVTNVTRIEVWITNRSGVTQNVRDVVGLADLGEAEPASGFTHTTAGLANGLPQNGANDLYGKLAGHPSYRFVDNIVSTLLSFGLQQGQDFEKTYARKLNTNEFTYNAQLGYISLNSQMNPNDVLAVAYQYEYNGKVYQVGEFGDQVPPDSSATSKVLYLKLLKGTSIRTNLPIWNLMMKNIYSLGAFNVSPQDFYLDIYYNDPGGGLKRYMPQGCKEGVPLLRDLNLDNLDANNNPQPDGLFDFIPGITIVPQNGRLIFPVLKPFGDDLKKTFCPADVNIVNNYIYPQLYDSTKFVAQQYPEFNRFVIKGQYKGSNGSQISLGAGNIPKGSVVVTAGGQKLTEGTDYTVDYNLGRLTIINQSILNSGQQIKVDYENNNQFATQVRSLLGTRLDYKISNKFNIGATLMQLSERPFTQKVNIGDDPIKNTIMGADVKYETNAPWLTKAISALPFSATKEMSIISTYGEVAYLKPGHNKAINDPQKQGQVYIDDFEGTSTGYDLKNPSISWKLASTPRNSPGPNGQPMFPEANLINDERYGYNRAKIAWYRIDNSFFNQQTSPAVVYGSGSTHNTLGHYVRLIPYQEVFPNSPVTTLDQNLYTFDISYFPKERGPYNFEAKPTITNGPGGIISRGITNTGQLNSPQTRWGGIMRSIDNSDLEATNVEYIEFWMLDPFIYTPTSSGGRLYINLGSISEDILRDSRMAFENGLSDSIGTLDSTFWGEVPRLPPLVNAFDNNPDLRPVQDVGLDGEGDVEERRRKAQFLSTVSTTLSSGGAAGAAALAQLNNDPATDDFQYFQDENIYGSVSSILTRYKNFCGIEGNSPVQTNSIATTAGTNLPDKEDINNDNTLNEDEEYFQYEVDLRPNMTTASNPFIVTVEDATNDPNIGRDDANVTSRWLQFRIPIRQYNARVGNIPDFKSIQFMRMFLTGFSDDNVVLRFGTLQLTRNQWRTYNLDLNDACDGTSPHGGQVPFFNVGSVGIENNAAKTPVNYVLPPNIERQQALGQQTNQYVAQDEQSLAVSVCDLQDCQRKAVFKNLGLDLRNYKRLQMFIHANRILGENVVHDKEVTAFIRIGSDFVDNYYEYEIPLRVTPDGLYDETNTSLRNIVWPDSNNMDITLQDFISLKEKRNATPGYGVANVFSVTDIKGNIISIKGNPDIGSVQTMMLGVHNPYKGDPNNPNLGKDDGQAKCVEVWFDELRANGLDQTGGMAAIGTVNVKLADLGNVSLGGSMHTAGFGQVEQKLDQRYKDNMYSYNFATGIDGGKLLPKVLGIRIPFYANYAQTFSTPKYDPYQFDITSKEMVSNLKNLYGGDSARAYKQQIQTINTNRGFNFTNVRIVPKTKAKRPHIYDPGNFNFTYSYNELLLSDPYTEKNSKKTWMGLIGWSFAPQTKDLAPFKKIIRSKSKWLDLVRDFSFNPFPSTLSVTTQMTRVLNEIKLRSLGEVDFPIPASYSKNFIWSRNYALKYNPFKSLSIDYSAIDNARIDEQPGLLDTKAKRDDVWNQIGKGGRNTSYNQSLAVNYNIPINKIPILDFITPSVGYASTYNWTALPLVLSSDPVEAANGVLVQNTLGNIISNSQNDRAKVDLNIKKLYDKIPFLKTYDSPNPSVGDKKENDKKREAIKNARKKISEEIAKLKEKREKLKQDLAMAKADSKVDTTGKKEFEIKKIKQDLKANRKAIRLKKVDLRSKQFPSDPLISLIMRPLLSLKKITVEYKENKSTILPGFTGYSRLLGVDYKNNSPGYGFTFGQQPGDKFFNGVDAFSRSGWLDQAAAKGWITRDTLLNQQFVQNRSQRLDITTTLEPFPDFKIDLNLFRDNTFNHSEFFKYDSAMGFQHLNPMDMGTYSISYIPVKTMFKKIDNLGYSQTYATFEANRSIISKRLGKINPSTSSAGNGTTPYYLNPSTGEIDKNYAAGYGPLSQDVLIPAFLAAYTKSDPNKVSLNPFKSVPLPNWRIAYTGLSKFKWIQKIFTNVTISHGYNSTLSISSFQTNLSYMGDGTLSKPTAKDSLSGNFISLYNMPSIMLNEQFSPLLGIDMTFKNGLTAKADYKTSRTMTMSFADFQMIEMKSKQITVGAGYKIKGLKLPIKINGKKIRLDNDLNFRFDFSYRDNITVNHRIDQGDPQITAGSTTYQISPSIDYVVSKRLNVRLFFDQTRTIPKISSSYPTTNTKGGITFRFSLAE